MQSRIDRLENLVLSLMHQTGSSAPDQRARLSPSPPEVNSERATTQRDVSPTPSDHGRIRIQHTVVSYVSSSHWAAILDSITDLRSHLTREEETYPREPDLLQQPTSFPRPQLLYCCLMHETPASIVKSLPPRPVVDRLVSRYFNILDIAPGVVHSSRFLREYEEFWKAPHAVPIIWVGLLFGMMCLSTQLQQSFLPTMASPALGQLGMPPEVAESKATVDRYREMVVQCLILGHYTKGGPYVLETLILYFLVECFHLKDMEIGIWVLVGNIVQIAIHMGFHRDAKHFPNISPFDGEMRRRIWAMIVQLDFSISMQLGLPRLVKESQTNTAEPRNLYDSDFDEHTAELPASRPETEVTPTLYVLAKLRLITVGVKVADMATEPRLHSYADILELDHQINEARNALPSSLKWDGLSSTLNIPSQVIIQKIWLEVTIQQLKIVLHRKFLDPSRLHEQYELQRLVDEETQTDGLLYQSRWRVSSAFLNDFLLATSILCFCLQGHIDEQKAHIDDQTDTNSELVDMNRIRQLLKTSQAIWRRQCASSREARKAVTALRLELEQANESTAWPGPATALNGDVEHWPGVTSSREMDLSS
ncbi:hypothetical protein EKO27_g2691 [Xylaria grammica]|uniref:Xylanolytic transcriptional activator regulatory domain-containing protein n=1 Tax=Xylaria grammica TaxID=363999 RepID=A0A439DDC9_9PEZI|nr:hypothetical protein EKO27_g2691 [Xylaria grammica]